MDDNTNSSDKVIEENSPNAGAETTEKNIDMEI